MMQIKNKAECATSDKGVNYSNELQRDKPKQNSISAEEFLASAPKLSNNPIEPSSYSIANELLNSLLPTNEDDSVITALKILGLYKEPLGIGKHDITCPWVSEHSKERDNGTVYFEGKGKNSIGGFKCQHTHCKERNTQHFIASLEKAIAELEARAE